MPRIIESHVLWQFLPIWVPHSLVNDIGKRRVSKWANRQNNHGNNKNREQLKLYVHTKLLPTYKWIIQAYSIIWLWNYHFNESIYSITYKINI
jgi:hypothetical protein